MGFFSHVFAATHEAADAYFVSLRDTSIPKDCLAEYKGLHPGMLGPLWAVLRGEEYALGHDLIHVRSQDDGGKSLFRFPKGFVRRLANIDPRLMSRVAHAWAASDEDLNGKAKALKEPLENSQRLAAIALEGEKGLYLYINL